MKSDSSSPENVFAPTSQGELIRFLAENFAGPKRAIAPVGGRTALDFGYPLSKPAVTVATAGLAQVVDFPARDMTITVEAGIRIDHLAEILRGEGQRLPLDVALPQRATLGGVIATNANGPRRFGCGTIRDYLIGVSAVTAEGRPFHSGGRVVKNVAGYDLCKLLVGSLGTLAVVTQATLKLKPAPASSVLVWSSFASFADMDAALGEFVTSRTRPAAIEALNSTAACAIEAEARVGMTANESVLVIGFEGSPRETEWQIETLANELSRRRPNALDIVRDAGAARLWTALTEFPVCSDEPLTFQAHLPPSKLAEFYERGTRLDVALLSHAADGIVIGKLPDEVANADQAAQLLSPLLASARESGGNLIVLHCDQRWKGSLPVFGVTESAHAWRRKIKHAFDPDDLLNPGRMFPA